jgi:hypothetical protein
VTTLPLPREAEELHPTLGSQFLGPTREALEHLTLQRLALLNRPSEVI